jgi:F-type H+-transporting ATPase subunit a
MEQGGADVLFRVFGLEVTGAVTTMWAVMALIIAVLWLAGRRVERIPRSRLQSLVEIAIAGGENLFSSVMSPKRARQFLPLLGSFFVFILVCNYSGLIPGAGEFRAFKPPTSHWGVTGGLAAVTFCATQYVGIRSKGLRYFKHFIEPLFLAPLMLPLSILEELVRPFSLSLRLFANIFGGETVLLALLLVIPYFLPITTLVLELIFGFVQAFIFTMLTAVYLAGASETQAH